jgi:hypothetical protein
MKTRPDGLVALVLPYEWVSRPSARAIRQHIDDNGWSVSVFRFNLEIFQDVLTTASISIIDKRRRNRGWQYHDVLPSLSTRGSVKELTVLGILSCLTHVSKAG